MKVPLWVWTVFLVVALLATPVVSAENTNGYKVRPSIGNASGGNTSADAINPLNVITPLTVSNSIIQGQTIRHQFNIGSGVRWLEVNLDWISSSDSLALTVYTPGWAKVGTYHDIDDGVIDGKIHIDIIPNSGYVEQGAWTFDVYGERVATQRTYYLDVYQHY
ncbi:peptidase [Candidatus Methanoperedens nitratireducens]|uniref:peptidase n=1 Tax=Candidatus Methanoperedens nitratireducens TaxID=1392998 RepID=UPI000BB825DB|nr:peptidase [Candidatus Methanoperedens nitroreducens]